MSIEITIEKRHIMKTNVELQTDVQNAIKWEPLLQAAEIGVITKDGVVSLSGEVDSYAKKVEAENAAKSVIGVKGLIEKIQVKFSNSWKKTDTQIMDDVLKALDASWSVPKDKLKIKVENGWITLSGELPWNYQRENAEYAINFLEGVKGVTNDISIRSVSQDAIEQKDVEKALRRSALDDSDIKVRVSGTTITLFGTVNSWYQKEEAERIAWKTNGIWHVKNKLTIDYYYDLVE